jgi:spermidine synthase
MNNLKSQTATGRITGAASFVLYALILLSGAAGLVYEVVWARQLTLFMGNTAVANAAVLSAFMLGLALGSLWLGRIADSTDKPLRMYALLEILIGCYGVTTPWLFDLLQAAYAQFAGVVGVSGAYSHLPRFLVAVIAMLIPTFLMGGTLPLLVKHFTQHLSQAQSVTSRIYGINTLGATCGAFAAGFLLLPAFGITVTLLQAAAVNIVVGLGVYILLAKTSLKPLVESSHPETLAPTTSGEPIPAPWLLLAGFGLSGFAALLYQVVWIHALILVIGVSIYAFSTVLTVYLAGIALGSLLIGKLFTYRDAKRGLKLAFYLQMGIALSAVASLGLISYLPILFVQGWSKLHQSFVLFQAYMFLLAGLAIIIPTILLGALFPLITGIWSQRKNAVGKGVGEAYGANALGTIAGSAIGGLFILDWLGMEHSLYLASAVSTVVAVLFWYLAGPHRTFSNRWIQGPLAAGLLLLAVLALPGLDRSMLQAETFRRAHRFTEGNVSEQIKNYVKTFDFLYYKEGIHGTVSVIRWVKEGLQSKALMNNGKIDASNSSDMMTQILLGQIPMFLHPNPEEVMVIGLGSGVTAGSVLRSPAVRNMDLLEISPEVVEASAYFRQENNNALDDPRANLIVADARNYLLATDKKFNVIISEPSHSWVTGVANLFTRDFLQLVKNRLADDGMLVQWYHIYGVDRDSFKSMLKAIQEVFPHYSLWYAIGGDLIIVSSNKPLELDYQEQTQFFSSREISDDMQRIGLTSVEQMMSRYMMSSSQIVQLLAGHPANTDDHPVVEFNAPKYIYESTTDDNVRMLFGELSEAEFALPVSNLVQQKPGWIAVPFMGVGLRTGSDGYSSPQWNVVRTSIPLGNDDQDEEQNYHLMGGMNGAITLYKPWGEVNIHATMVDRGVQPQTVLFPMMENDVPRAEQIQSGELRAPNTIVYWRVGPSTQPGKLRVALGRQCERPSGFDSFIAIRSDYPGDAELTEDVQAAVQTVNHLVECR